MKIINFMSKYFENTDLKIFLWNLKTIYYVGHLFSILIENLGSETKTEWENCPISQFLGLDFELFQIKQVCVKKINNKP